MLIILEMANNHNGSVGKGKLIIDEFSHITKDYPGFEFAFKFQRRNLDYLIHPDYIDRDDIPAIKRFKDTQLRLNDLIALMVYARKKGFKIICTPFDEVAVDEIKDLGLDYIKVGSCSANDWPLLNKVAETKLPVIISVGGLDHTKIGKVVEFCRHRQLNFSLLHCVGTYPTLEEDVCLKRLQHLHNYSVKIGFSSHEPGGQHLSVALAVSMGATIIEKHVDLSIANSPHNAYSIEPFELRAMLDTIISTQNICQGELYWERHVKKEEVSKLNSFKRGVFLNQDIKKGNAITRDMLTFALPVLDRHITVDRCGKYNSFIAARDIKANEPITIDNIIPDTNEHIIRNIHNAIINILDRQMIPYRDKKLELSHHYGLDKFGKYGMAILTVINKQYCKKVLILHAGQENPPHYHCEKTETFLGVHGKAIITIDNNTKHKIGPGDMITLLPYQSHSIKASDNSAYTILEEISTEHVPNDSVYIDNTINKNKNRKTEIYL